MYRRTFLKTAGAGALLAGFGIAWAKTRLKPLPILPLNDLTGEFDKRIQLNLNAAAHDFGSGAASRTLGINSNYLGQVLRVKQGQTLPFDIVNGIGEVTTIHWHGLHIPGEVDGGPHQTINPGHTWAPDVPIRQQAATTWFHSHMHGRTAQQVYKGLAGLMLIEDDASLSADLPRTYGVDDFTIVLQDKKFDDDGTMSYSVSGRLLKPAFSATPSSSTEPSPPTEQHVPAGPGPAAHSERMQRPFPDFGFEAWPADRHCVRRWFPGFGGGDRESDHGRPASATRCLWT